MERTTIKSRFAFVLAPLLTFLLAVLAWQAVCTTLGVREYLVPSPLTIMSVLKARSAMMINDTVVTTWEALLGFLLANLTSLLAAIAFVHIPWLERSCYPYAIALKSVPIVVFAPLFVIWFGFGQTGKVVMAGVVAFFPLVVNATKGLKEIPVEELDLFRSLGATRSQILFKLRFPRAMPYIFSALRISSTMAVLGALIGEMAGADRGLGYTIMVSSYNSDTPTMFAAAGLASLVSLVFFGAVVLLEILLIRQPVREDIRKTLT